MTARAAKSPVCVIGAGTMGHGIAQVLAMAEFPVRLYDPDPTVLAAARERIDQSLSVFQELDLFPETETEACLNRLTLCQELDQACQEVWLIFEAAPEDLELKQELYGAVENLTAETTILATNTSGLSITALSMHLKHPERFLGTHFWNPAQVIPLVEVIKGHRTSDQVLEQVMTLLEQAGKKPVWVRKEVPGFIGNRLQHALQREALYLVEQGICQPEDVDLVVKSGFGLRYAYMGPFERADLGGLDTTYQVDKYLLADLDNRPEASRLLAEKIKAGELGIKTGRGFYDWQDERLSRLAETRDRVLLNVIRLIEKLGP